VTNQDNQIRQTIVTQHCMKPSLIQLHCHQMKRDKCMDLIWFSKSL